MVSSGELRQIVEDFGRFLSNPKIVGIKSSLGENIVNYSLSRFQFEIEFINEFNYTIEVSNKSKLKEEFQIPYIHSNEIDYHTIFQNGCGLARRLTNGE
jgi:hypothetical protein